MKICPIHLLLIHTKITSSYYFEISNLDSCVNLANNRNPRTLHKTQYFQPSQMLGVVTCEHVLCTYSQTPIIMEDENVDYYVGLEITIVSQIKHFNRGQRHALVRPLRLI